MKPRTMKPTTERPPPPRAQVAPDLAGGLVCSLQTQVNRLQAEVARLNAANKARDEYLRTRKTSTAVDRYVDLVEAQIADLKAERERIRIEHTCPRCGAALLTETLPHGRTL